MSSYITNRCVDYADQTKWTGGIDQAEMQRGTHLRANHREESNKIWDKN